jgi:hypothetical protein
MIGIIHIGTEKTGTTSFQDFMKKHHSNFLRLGLLYPEKLGKNNHRMLATYSVPFEASKAYLRKIGIFKVEDFKIFCSTTEAQLRRQVHDSCDVQYCVISSEHFHSRVQELEQIRRIKRLFDELFERVEIYVHLRPQIDVMTSLASTAARGRGIVRKNFFERTNADSPYFNYNLLVSRWEEVFGVENVFCIPFLNQPSLLPILSARTRVNFEKFGQPERKNEALDVRVIAALNRIKSQGRVHLIKTENLENIPVELRLNLSRCFAKEIQKRFEMSNDLLTSRRAELPPTCLEPIWSKYPENGTLDILENPDVHAAYISDISMHLLNS